MRKPIQGELFPPPVSLGFADKTVLGLAALEYADGYLASGGATVDTYSYSYDTERSFVGVSRQKATATGLKMLKPVGSILRIASPWLHAGGDPHITSMTFDTRVIAPNGGSRSPEWHRDGLATGGPRFILCANALGPECLYTDRPIFPSESDLDAVEAARTLHAGALRLASRHGARICIYSARRHEILGLTVDVVHRSKRNTTNRLVNRHLVRIRSGDKAAIERSKVALEKLVRMEGLKMNGFGDGAFSENYAALLDFLADRS